jgi:hypothetical protein
MTRAIADRRVATLTDSVAEGAIAVVMAGMIGSKSPYHAANSPFSQLPDCMPSLTVENYVKAIYQITSQQGEPAATGQLAAALGVSLLVGYTLGSIGGDDTRTQPQRGEPFRYYGEPNEDRVRSTRERDNDSRGASFAQHADIRRAAQPGMIDQIMDQFGDEFQLLKAAALTSVISLVRDTVRRNLPALDQELGRLRSEQGGSAPMAARANDTARKTNSNNSSRYYDTADTQLRERAVGEVSTQADVGRSSNYDFIPPTSRAEPGGRP